MDSETNIPTADLDPRLADILSALRDWTRFQTFTNAHRLRELSREYFAEDHPRSF